MDLNVYKGVITAVDKLDRIKDDQDLVYFSIKLNIKPYSQQGVGKFTIGVNLDLLKQVKDKFPYKEIDFVNDSAVHLKLVFNQVLAGREVVFGRYNDRLMLCYFEVDKEYFMLKDDLGKISMVAYRQLS